MVYEGGEERGGEEWRGVERSGFVMSQSSEPCQEVRTTCQAQGFWTVSHESISMGKKGKL